MNKLIIVTGGTRGIGRAIVRKFASHQFDVATCARNAHDLEALSEEIKMDYPSMRLFTFKADLSQKTETLDFIRFITDMKREVEVLVNNTGIFFPGSIHEEEDGVLETMINTNLYSAYRLSRGILPGMMDAKHGHVFNICSTASIMPYVNGGSYCISKFAMYGMSKVLREEMKPYGIKVTAVLPGATKTSSWEGVDLPEDRFVKPEDIADTIWAVYSLSPNADVEEILVRPQLGDI